MRFVADIETIRVIENRIISANNCTLVNMVDKSNQHPSQSTEKSRAFSHTYEVYLSEGASKDLLQAIVSPKVFVHFWFDYRVGKANVCISRKGLETLEPVLDGLMRDLEAIRKDYYSNGNRRYQLRPVLQQD